MKKLLYLVILTMLMSMGIVCASYAKELPENQWITLENGGKGRTDANGNLIVSKAVWIDFHKYYFDKNGKLVKNKFITRKEKTYYANKKGYLASGWKVIKNKVYYFDSQCVMKTGFQKISGKDYCFDQKGVMQSGWIEREGKRYYYRKDNGSLAKNTKIGKTKVGADGAAIETKK